MKPIPLNQIINKNNLDRTMVTTLDIEEIKEDDGITYDLLQRAYIAIP
jgi:hypothetical protein